ncbi:AzlD domain-containing protein [Thiohalorhabdus denitrificans]|uniref:AzlD domain-containing protein n=1 Tax=Thiohalorhabdus denitrificans TaxID=381306 RepID=UPI001E431ED0|nr:AzlD domain-containing protein [Thiohalorhabdus denitrificans]
MRRRGAPESAFALPPENGRPLAAALAVLVAWRSRNMLLTLAVGMVSLWLLEWLL